MRRCTKTGRMPLSGFHAPGRDSLRRGVLGLAALVLAGCSEPRDGVQTVKDSLFYDGLAAFHEGYHKEAAVRWERAARFGDGDAARNLGHLYRQGLGVEQDLPIAVAWYQVAIDSGIASAQYNLGMVYLKGGPNFPPDREQALHWLNSAAAAGITPARMELERLASVPAPAPAPAPAPPPPAVAAVAAVAPVPPPVPAPAVEKVRIQVGSYRSAKDAETDWLRLRRPGLEREIVSVRMKGQRLWHRLLAVGSPEDVEAFCRLQSAHRIGCWPGKAKPAK